jgi:hypothetical protein
LLSHFGEGLDGGKGARLARRDALEHGGGGEGVAALETELGERGELVEVGGETGTRLQRDSGSPGGHGLMMLHEKKKRMRIRRRQRRRRRRRRGGRRGRRRRRNGRKSGRAGSSGEHSEIDAATKTRRSQGAPEITSAQHQHLAHRLAAHFIQKSKVIRMLDLKKTR